MWSTNPALTCVICFIENETFLSCFCLIFVELVFPQAFSSSFHVGHFPRLCRNRPSIFMVFEIRNEGRARWKKRLVIKKVSKKQTSGSSINQGGSSALGECCSSWDVNFTCIALCCPLYCCFSYSFFAGWKRRVVYQMPLSLVWEKRATTTIAFFNMNFLATAAAKKRTLIQVKTLFLNVCLLIESLNVEQLQNASEFLLSFHKCSFFEWPPPKIAVSRVFFFQRCFQFSPFFSLFNSYLSSILTIF